MTVVVVLVVVMRMGVRDPIVRVLVRMFGGLIGLVVVGVVVMTVVVRVLVGMSNFFVSVRMGMIRHGKLPLNSVRRQRSEIIQFLAAIGPQPAAFHTRNDEMMLAAC